jgi:hypothetical protein
MPAARCVRRRSPPQPLLCLRDLLRSCWRWPSLVTVRDVNVADTAVPVDALVPGETTTCLFRSAGSLVVAPARN